MILFYLMILTVAVVGEVAEDQRPLRYDVFYCVMDAAVDAIGITPLREAGYVPTGNELRVWVSRGREADLLLRVTKKRGEVVAQFVAFEESIGNEIPGRHCGVLGLNVGIKVLNSHVVPLTERSPILHHLLANGAWTLESSEPNVALGNSMSLILERHNKGSYSIDAHDNPEITDGQDEVAACRIIRVLDEYAAKIGLKFNPDSCAIRSGGLDPNYWLNLTVRPVTVRASARPAPAARS
ncbi:MAG: hypothetical protein ACYTBS_08480 [Planctomycetota bacterium]|jgi:hypothetical protein